MTHPDPVPWPPIFRGKAVFATKEMHAGAAISRRFARGGYIKPAAIAEEVWNVAHQERCAWSFNVEVRPFRETW